MEKKKPSDQIWKMTPEASASPHDSQSTSDTAKKPKPPPLQPLLFQYVFLIITVTVMATATIASYYFNKSGHLFSRATWKSQQISMFQDSSGSPWDWKGKKRFLRGLPSAKGSEHIQLKCVHGSNQFVCFLMFFFFFLPQPRPRKKNHN